MEHKCYCYLLSEVWSWYSYVLSRILYRLRFVLTNVTIKLCSCMFRFLEVDLISVISTEVV